jgi:hypothetical protein
MKAISLALVTTVIVSGCRSVDTAKVPRSVYPFPPVALSQFCKSPTDGFYSVPASAASERELLSHDIIVVSGGAVHLSRFQNGRVSTNVLDLVEFRPYLPSEEIFQQVAAETTESEIARQFGKPTREGFDYYPFIGLKSESTKHVAYSWFAVSESSQITFMLVNVSYRKGKGGEWSVESLNWERWGGRDFSSNKITGANAGGPRQLPMRMHWTTRVAQFCRWAD